LSSGAAFPVGTTTNAYRVTDASGNSATCSFTVEISDNELPTITCPANITGNNDPGLCSKVVTFTAPVGADNCTGQTTTQTAGLSSGAAFPVGTTTNAYRVTDAAGNSATCSFTVVISDNELPTITCPANVTGNNDPGLCSKVVTFTAPVGTDNCPSATTIQTAGLSSGAAFPVGTTTNAYRVTDASGNSATCSFTVVISDNELPTITCPANITGNNDPGLCSKVVTFTAPVGADNCTGQTTTQTAGLASGAAFPVGTTTNAYRVTDASGNSATCSFTVVISDNELPTITCPASISVSNSVNACSAVVTFATPLGADNCTGQTTTQTAGLASGAAFPVGTTTNAFLVTDAAGNSATCSFIVVISDNQLPTITCPSGVSAGNGLGQCSAVVTFTAPVGTDNCPSATTTQTAGLASGAAFPVGTTTNVFRVTDASGNSATCSFTVVISDNELPTISCPANVSASNSVGACSAVVTFTAPVGTDNCPSAITTQTAGLASGAAFPVGTTTNTFRVTDASGNSATCSFAVVISDNELPTITCPANITGNNDPGLCSKVVTFTAPVGTDNCPGAITTQTAGLASGAAFPVGTTTNAYRVTDAAGNTATCSFTVVISDNQLPTIICPANITGNNDPGLCSKVVTFTAPVGADNCAGQTTTQTAGLGSGTAFPVGTTTNVFHVTDASGNSATCSFTVVISDNQLPTITCPANITGNNDPGLCSKVVTFTAPVGSDNCPSAITTQTAGLASGAAFPVGTTTNAYRVTDASGNSATCSFTVIISDNQLPTITCPANITGNNDPGLCSKVVTFTAPVGTDNCPSAITTQTAGLASGAAFPVGTTTNAYRVTDASGNSATCSFTVIISDNQLPTITCPANVSASNSVGACSAVVTFTAPVGTDNCPSAITIQTAGLASGAAFPVGTTTNAYRVTDASGNSATCSFTVIISDNQLPTITCPANVSASNSVGACSAVVTFTAPVGTDNCPSATTAQSAGLSSGAAFPVGTTTNIFRVTDAAGNTATCSFTVVISDNELPTITCPANITGNNDPGLCSKVVTFTAPVGTDNCPSATSTQTAGLSGGTAFPVGTTTNAYRVTDAFGNTATCNFTVVITDNQLPTITCPANISVSNSVNACSAVVTFATPLGADNCAGQTTTQTAGLASGAAFPVGTTTNAFLVTDAAGNSATCSFIVVVSDNQLPTITCPNGVSASNGLGQCSAVVTFTAPVGVDNCPGATTTQTAGLASGAAFPVGTTTNAFRVTDASGNTATCSFAVVITDNQLPTITCPANITGNNDPGQCSKVVTFTAPVGADNCPSATTTQTAGLGSGAAFAVGTTTNTFRVTDASGNSATCSFTVIISDNQLPTITCPANITGNTDPGLCSKVVTFSTPIGNDNCPGAITASTGGLTSGASFPIGTTTNAYRVTDASGNSATCSFTVVISDNELPTITCPSGVSVSNGLGLCSAVVTFTAPVGADNCSGQTTTQTSGLSSGAAFPVGITTNAYRVTDAAGNSATCSFTVTVSDNQLPTITCPANISVSASVGVCSAVVTFTAPVGADNCSGQTTTQTAGLTSGAAFPIGITTNAYRVTDAAGNSATCSLTVTVSDTQLPTITCPSNVNVNSDAGQCNAVVTFTAPVGTDNCPGATTIQVGGLLSGSAFAVGTTSNVFRVTDAAGNSATCSFAVVVVDNQAPQWTGCPSNVVLVADSMSCGNTHSWTVPTAFDECGVSTSTSTHNPNDFFPADTTTVVYTATDPSGNTTTCSFTVTVNPTPLVASLIVSEAGCYNIGCHGDSTGSVFSQVNGGCLPYSYLWSNGDTTSSLIGIGAGTYTLTVTDANGTTAVLGVTMTEPAALTAVISGTQAVCAGDSSASLTVATSGGNDCAAYHLLWSTGDTTNSIGGLPAGTYTLTLTDSLGCTVTESWTVMGEALPVVNLGADTSKCPGIDLVLTGPSGYANYLWSNNATGATNVITQPGTYWLQVESALGCIGSDTIVVGENVVNNNLITPDGPLTICDNVQLTLTALSGQVNYLWNTGSTNPAIVVVNAGGPFWVHAEDANGCIAKDTVIVNYQPFTNPNPQIVPGPAAFLCQGGALVLDAQSGYFAYSWSTGATTQTITVTAPGTFNVTVSNGFGCSKTSPAVVVTEVPNPVPPIFLNSGTLSTANYASYQWILNGSNIFGATWPTFVPGIAGWYQIAVVDANGCQGISDSLFVSLVGMGDAAEGNSGLSLYPNPTSGMVHLLSDMPIETAVEVEVWDMFGRKVKVFNFSHLRTEAELDLTDIARATYTVKVKTTRRQPELQAIFKLVIQ
jgi:hypothetical protein